MPAGNYLGGAGPTEKRGMVHCQPDYRAQTEQCGEYDESPHPSARYSYRRWCRAAQVMVRLQKTTAWRLPEPGRDDLIGIKRRLNRGRKICHLETGNFAATGGCGVSCRAERTGMAD